MKYKTKILVDYPDQKGVEAAVPEVLEEHQLLGYIKMLIVKEKDMTAFRVEVEVLRK